MCNVWLLKFKLISQNEIFLLLFISFYSWFQHFTSEIDKGENAPIQCVDYKQCLIT